MDLSFRKYVSRRADSARRQLCFLDTIQPGLHGLDVADGLGIPPGIGPESPPPGPFLAFPSLRPPQAFSAFLDRRERASPVAQQSRQFAMLDMPIHEVVGSLNKLPMGSGVRFREPLSRQARLPNPAPAYIPRLPLRRD